MGSLAAIIFLLFHYTMGKGIFKKLASGDDNAKKKGKKYKKPEVAIKLAVEKNTTTAIPLEEAMGPPITLEKILMAANCVHILAAT